MNRNRLERSATLQSSIPMGEIRTAQTQGVLRTLLGSCLGVSLWDRRLRIGALAHIVLPASNGKTGQPGKYADMAIPEMIRMLREISGRDRLLLQAKIAGGANMFATAGNQTVGEMNQTAVEQLLEELRIPILGRHLGGEQGRRMSLDVATGIVTIEIVGSESSVI
jgi:chemotaxis protein CheD